jgi:hypothetical protein
MMSYRKWEVSFLNSHNGGWSPNWTHSARPPFLAYFTCLGWFWGWTTWWNEDWQGKPKYSEKTCPSATLSNTIFTWPDPERGGVYWQADRRLASQEHMIYTYSYIHTYIQAQTCIQDTSIVFDSAEMLTRIIKISCTWRWFPLAETLWKHRLSVWWTNNQWNMRIKWLTNAVGYLNTILSERILHLTLKN